jgi:hypothetical protein
LSRVVAHRGLGRAAGPFSFTGRGTGALSRSLERDAAGTCARSAATDVDAAVALTGSSAFVTCVLAAMGTAVASAKTNPAGLRSRWRRRVQGVGFR